MFGPHEGLVRRCFGIQTPTHKVFGRLGYTYKDPYEITRISHGKVSGTPGSFVVAEKWVQMGDENLKEFPSCFVKTFKGFVELNESMTSQPPLTCLPRNKALESAY